MLATATGTPPLETEASPSTVDLPGERPAPPPRWGALIDGLRVFTALVAISLAVLRPPGDPPLIAIVAMYAALAGGLAIARLWDRQGACRAHWPWVDTLMLLAIYAFSGGAREFYPLLFIPIFFGAIHGRTAGTLLALVNAAGVASVLVAQPVQVQELLLLPLAVLLLGVVATWVLRRGVLGKNGMEFASRTLERFSARGGIENTLRGVLPALAQEYDASTAMLAIGSHEGPIRVFVQERGTAATEMSLANAGRIGKALLDVPGESCVNLGSHDRFGRTVQRMEGYDIRTGQTRRLRELPAGLEGMVDLLGERNMLLVPVGRDALKLRLVMARDGGPFEPAVAQVLHQVLGLLAPLLDNALLLERLMSAAAEVERSKIGRDLHDSAVQPYIGLKFGIEALARRVPDDSPLAADVRRLLGMANDELHNMREVVSGLRGNAAGLKRSEGMLADAVKRQAERFSELFSINVDVLVTGRLPTSRRLAGEVLHLVAEALSNVRRHTRARRVEVTLDGSDTDVLLRVFNHRRSSEPVAPKFEPRSLAERAAALGGRVNVTSDTKGTMVRITLPLPDANTVLPQPETEPDARDARSRKVAHG